MFRNGTVGAFHCLIQKEISAKQRKLSKHVFLLSDKKLYLRAMLMGAFCGVSAGVPGIPFFVSTWGFFLLVLEANTQFVPEFESLVDTWGFK